MNKREWKKNLKLKKKNNRYQIELKPDIKNLFNRISESGNAGMHPSDVNSPKRSYYAKGTFGPASECRSLTEEEIIRLYGGR